MYMRYMSATLQRLGIHLDLILPYQQIRVWHEVMFTALWLWCHLPTRLNRNHGMHCHKWYSINGILEMCGWNHDLPPWTSTSNIVLMFLSQLCLKTFKYFAHPQIGDKIESYNPSLFPDRRWSDVLQLMAFWCSQHLDFGSMSFSVKLYEIDWISFLYLRKSMWDIR